MIAIIGTTTRYCGMRIHKKFLVVAAVFVAITTPAHSDWDYNFDGREVSILSYTGTESIVTVPTYWWFGNTPYPVTRLEPEIFGNRTDITSVTLPDYLKSIGSGAFYGCSNLRSINLPNGLEGIEEFAFSSSGLESITIPSSVKRIGNYAFYECRSLSTITFSPAGSVLSIGEWAFVRSGITHIVLPEGITDVQRGAFWQCRSLVTASLPDSMRSVSDDLFGGCSSLNYIKLPQAVLHIGKNAFLGCTSLSSTVFLPRSTISIGESSFEGCANLTEVVLYEGLLRIGEQAFLGCSKLSPSGWTPRFLPKSVRSIGAKAFVGSGLSNVAVSILAEVDPSAFDPDVSIEVDVAPLVANSAFINAIATNDVFITALANKIAGTTPNNYGIATKSDLGVVASNATTQAISQVQAAPNDYNLYSSTQYEANRAAGQSEVINSPMSYGLYTPDSIMDLRMKGAMVQKQGDDAKVIFQPQITSDLATEPFTDHGTPITNTIPMPGDKGFLRIQAR